MMDFIYNMTNTFEFSALIKIIVITILSGIIGLEREAWNKPAGFKTHTLVGISATLVMIAGEYFASINNSDPSRIAAQLLSGIGFIGAGTILRDGFNVKGLTTAASLLAVTCIGLSVGAGFYIGAVIATAVVFIILSYSKWLVDRVEKMNKYNFIKLHIELEEQGKIMNKLESMFETYQILIDSISINKENENIIEIIGKYKDEIEKNKIILQIASFDEVKIVKEII